MLYFSSPCSKEHGCGIVRHSNWAKQRKCPIMDWKASEEQSEETVGRVGMRYISKETLLFVGSPCFDIYLNSSRKVDFLGVSNNWRGEKWGKGELGRASRLKQPETLTQWKVSTDRKQRETHLWQASMAPPYHLWRREIIRQEEKPLMHTNKASSQPVTFKLINKQSKITWWNVLNLNRRRQ